MKVELPRQYRDKGDGVSYVATGGQGGKRREFLRSSCYSAILGHLGEYEITCLPLMSQNSAPRADTSGRQLQEPGSVELPNRPPGRMGLPPDIRDSEPVSTC